MNKISLISEPNTLYVMQFKDTPSDVFYGSKIDRRKSKSNYHWTVYMLNGNVSCYGDDMYALFTEPNSKESEEAIKKRQNFILEYIKKYKIEVKKRDISNLIDCFKQDYINIVNMCKQFYQLVYDFKSAGEVINIDKTRLKSPAITGMCTNSSYSSSSYIYMSFEQDKIKRHIKLELKTYPYVKNAQAMIVRESNNEYGTNFIRNYHSVHINDENCNFKHTNKQKVDFYNQINLLNAAIEQADKNLRLNLKEIASKVQ